MPLPKKIPRSHTAKEKDKCRVLANRYELDKKLGSGNFGTAFLVKDRKAKDTKDDWKVMKEIPVGDLQPDETVDAMHEAKLLSKLEHPSIVKFHDSFLDGEFFCIVTEYCEGGDLDDVITATKKKGEMLEQPLVMEWFVQLVTAVQYMHSRRVLHRDLKTRNIFMRNNMVKIGDFGISRILMGTSDMATTFTGTPYYMSPEVLKHEGYNSKSDVWSIGCILYEMCSLKHAFDGQSLMGVMYKIVEGDIPQIPDKYSKEIQNIIKLMLTKDPHERPSASEVSKLSYVSKHIEKLKNTIVEKHHKEHSKEHMEIIKKESNDIAHYLGRKSHLSDLQHEEEEKFKNMSPRERMRIRKQQQADEQAHKLKEATADNFQQNMSRQAYIKERDHTSIVGKLIGNQPKPSPRPYAQYEHGPYQIPAERLADYGYNYRPTTAPEPSNQNDDEFNQSESAADNFGRTLPASMTVKVPINKHLDIASFDDRPITPLKDKLVYDMNNSSLDFKDGVPENPELAETYYSQFEDEFHDEDEDDFISSEDESDDDMNHLANYLEIALDKTAADSSITVNDKDGAFGPGAREMKIKNLRLECEKKLGNKEFEKAYEYLRKARFGEKVGHTMDENEIVRGLREFVKNPSECFLVDQLLFLEEQSKIAT